MLFGGLINSISSLTRSPAQNAIALAHRAARRRLQAGGAAAKDTYKRADNDSAGEFVLPKDIDAALVEAAIPGEAGRRQRPTSWSRR